MRPCRWALSLVIALMFVESGLRLVEATSPEPAPRGIETVQR
jgi:hypothetical protein